MFDAGMEDYLLRQMEVKREQMVEAAQLHGFTSIETVTYSQELDRLMNIYFRLFGKRKNYSLQTFKFAN